MDNKGLERLRGEIARGEAPVTGRDLTEPSPLAQEILNANVSTDHRLCGEAVLAVVLERLACFEAPAPAWEGDLLPARLSDYDPDWLDRFSLSGKGG